MKIGVFGFKKRPRMATFTHMISISPEEVSTAKLHGYLLGAVAPRPIAFASTVSKDGEINLSPYSFFNVFSANPPVVIFSPARRVRDNTTKHTLQNVNEVAEVVINIVSYPMVQQMSLSSTEYPKGVNEFEKAGFTAIQSETVTPPRVAEAPVQLECKVLNVVALGDQGGAGNLVIAQVTKLHINEEILDANGRIDPIKIDTVARMGGNWYSRSREGMFEVPKPLSSLGIGVDAIPASIRESHLLSGNDLGQLGNVEKLPTAEEVAAFMKEQGESESHFSDEQKHLLAKKFIQEGDVQSAWKILLAN